MRGALVLIAVCAVPAGAREIATADISVRVGPDGATADYVLSRPTTRFAFAPADVERSPEMVLATPGLTLGDDAVTAARPFRRFTLRIAPNTTERDAKYPLLTAIGAGGVLHVPALRGAMGAWRTRVRYRLAAGQIRLPAQGAEAVFVGPRALASDAGGFTVVAAPGTPDWIRTRSIGDLAAATRFFTQALGITLPTRPLLALRFFDDDGSSFVGDVVEGPVAVLRFHGRPWATASAQGEGRIRSFVFHEAFHFWNGGLTGNAEGTPAWLHEGGADYAALMAERETGAIDDAAVAQRIGYALTGCRNGLGERAMASLTTLPQGVRYPCGLTIQWLVDQAMRRASDGRRGVLSAWGTTIRTAAATPTRRYMLADFYAATQVPDIGRTGTIAQIVDGTGSERWQRLPDVLRPLGLSVRTAVTPATRLPAVLMHLLAQNCRDLPKGSSYGFRGGDAIRLQTPAGCGALAGDPIVRTVAGDSIDAIGAAGFARIVALCTSGAGVPVITGEGRALIARCTTPPDPPALSYIVDNWRPAAR